MARHEPMHLFHVKCVDCTAWWMSQHNLEDVEEAYFTNKIIDLDALTAYRFVWAMSAVHSTAYDHWKNPPTPLSKETRKYVMALLKELDERNK